MKPAHSSLGHPRLGRLERGLRRRPRLQPLPDRIRRRLALGCVGTYTFVLADAGRVTVASNAAAKTFSLPLNATLPYEIGTRIEVRNEGAGQLTANIPTGGTINGVNAASIILTLGQTVILWKRSTDGWTTQMAMGTSELNLPLVAAPGAPQTDRLNFFAMKLAGKMLPGFRGPKGADKALQAFLGQGQTATFMPVGNNNGNTTLLGMMSPTTGGFSNTTRNVATTNYFGRTRRMGHVSAATAAAVGQFRGVTQYTIGDLAAKNSGFFMTLRFGISDAAAVAGARMLMGVSSLGAPTNVEPATLLNTIGVGHGAADTNLRLYFGGSAAQTPIDLGANFPTNTLSVDMYELALFAPWDEQVVYWQVTRLNTGHVASGVLSGTVGTALPAATTLLAHWGYRTNNATALAVGLDVALLYIETDG